MQHRQHGSGTHPGAEQHDSTRTWSQSELTVGGRDVDDVTNTHLLMKVAAGDALLFESDADPVPLLGVRCAGHRVAADDRMPVGRSKDPQRQVLAWARL